MKSCLFQFILAFLCPLACLAQGQPSCIAANPALTPIEAELLDIIKGSNKTVYVRTPGPLPLIIATELEDRQKPENRKDWSSKKLIKIMTADVDPIVRLWHDYKTRVSVRASQRYAEKPEAMVIGESIVVLGFSSPEAMEVIRDRELAKSYIAEFKKDSKWNEVFHPEAVRRQINRTIANQVLLDTLVAILTR